MGTFMALRLCLRFFGLLLLSKSLVYSLSQEDAIRALQAYHFTVNEEAAQRLIKHVEVYDKLQKNNAQVPSFLANIFAQNKADIQQHDIEKQLWNLIVEMPLVLQQVKSGQPLNPQVFALSIFLAMYRQYFKDQDPLLTGLACEALFQLKPWLEQNTYYQEVRDTLHRLAAQLHDVHDVELLEQILLTYQENDWVKDENDQQALDLLMARRQLLLENMQQEQQAFEQQNKKSQESLAIKNSILDAGRYWLQDTGIHIDEDRFLACYTIHQDRPHIFKQLQNAFTYQSDIDNARRKLKAFIHDQGVPLLQELRNDKTIMATLSENAAQRGHTQMLSKITAYISDSYEAIATYKASKGLKDTALLCAANELEANVIAMIKTDIEQRVEKAQSCKESFNKREGKRLLAPLLPFIALRDKLACPQEQINEAFNLYSECKERYDKISPFQVDSYELKTAFNTEMNRLLLKIKPNEKIVTLKRARKSLESLKAGLVILTNAWYKFFPLNLWISQESISVAMKEKGSAEMDAIIEYMMQQPRKLKNHPVEVYSYYKDAEYLLTSWINRRELEISRWVTKIGEDEPLEKPKLSEKILYAIQHDQEKLENFIDYAHDILQALQDAYHAKKVLGISPRELKELKKELGPDPEKRVKELLEQAVKIAEPFLTEIRDSTIDALVKQLEDKIEAIKEAI
jgi:hypothetical protein